VADSPRPGLRLFRLIFIGALVYVLRPSRREYFDEAGKFRCGGLRMSVDNLHDSKIRIDEHSGTPTTGHEWTASKSSTRAAALVGVDLLRDRDLVARLLRCLSGLAAAAWRDRGRPRMALAPAVVQDIADLQATRAPILAKIKDAPLDSIEQNPELLAAARTVGRVAFLNNCAACHGAGAQGRRISKSQHRRLDLGGKLADIKTTIEHGVRWDAISKPVFRRCRPLGAMAF